MAESEESMSESMQQAGFVLSPEVYKKIAQKAGNVEGYCWKCGKTRQYTADELEKLMRKWPTCKACGLKIHIRTR